MFESFLSVAGEEVENVEKICFILIIEKYIKSLFKLGVESYEEISHCRLASYHCLLT